MKITITKIDLVAVPGVNQIINMSWKESGQPDSAYVSLPDLTIDPSGNVLFPSPYIFNTGTISPDIVVRAINSCNPSYMITKTFEGLNLCCPAGYTLSPDGLQCSFTEIVAPNIIQAGVCVACSQLSDNYGIFGTKFWPAFNYDSALTNSNFTLLTTPYWRGNPPGGGTSLACITNSSPVVGNPPSPANRQAVWVDNNCDGTKDALSPGATLSFTWLVNSPVAKTVYVGICGDNNFALTLNGSTIVSSPNSGGSNNFRYLYVFPVQLISGNNFFAAQFIGDGTTSDMGAMFIIDNTAAEIPNITLDSQVNYIFQTSQMIGAPPIDVATCPAGYTLDTSGGVGNYRCVRVTTVPSTPC